MPILRARRQTLYGPLAVLGAVATLLFGGLYLVDWFLWSPSPETLREIGRTAKPGFLRELFSFDPETAQNALGNLAQVIAAVLGIVITVVSIVVQLAATRYTPRIAEMFFRDRTNILILGFFSVACIDAVWVSLSVSRGFVPRVTITGTLLMATLSVLIMLPYFAYVFDFLDPEQVVARIQEQALAAALSRRGTLELRQERVLASIEQLTDVAMNAIGQKDKLIAQGAVDALKTLAVQYLPMKLEAERGWFDISERLRQNPDFVSMSQESVDDLGYQTVWLEWKVLRQLQAIYGECLAEMPDMNHLVAIDTRYVGEAALAVGDGPALNLVVKFFNTYLRVTLNERKVRVAYNILNQYRQLAEKMIEIGHDPRAVEVAGHFRFYGQLAHTMGLGFVTETVGYDMAQLCEVAFLGRARGHDRLLQLLLDLDRTAETKEQEQMLRGVRKAQAKLASFYLEHGAEAHARLIYEDMVDEPVTRLRSIRDELLRTSTKDFWEVIDRGTNFDYLDDGRKERLREFFSWFADLEPAN